jgi:hypothetical protein
VYAYDTPETTNASEWADRAERTVTTLLIGKLVCASGAELCRIRNISATGMMIETARPLGYGNWLAVELRCGQKLQGSVAWASAGRAGVQFTTPIDVDQVLAVARGAAQPQAQQRRAAEPVPRAPRFDVDCPARINSNGRYIDVQVENVSQSGARIRLPRPPKADSQVILSIPGLPTRRAVARWSSDEVAGLSFLDVIPYNELSAWLGHAAS